MIGKMASTDLAESSFARVTAQVQCHGRIYMCSTASVSDTTSNGFMDCPTTKKQIQGHQQGLFHRLPDELQITLVIVAMEDALENRKSNNNDMNRQLTIRQMEAELTQEKGFKHSKDKFNQVLVYHRMCSSAA